jgi:hypothetical protein
MKPETGRPARNVFEALRRPAALSRQTESTASVFFAFESIAPRRVTGRAIPGKCYLGIRQSVLAATPGEIGRVRSYVQSQAPDRKIEFIQKVYSENSMTIRHDVWDVHTDVDRWWMACASPLPRSSTARFTWPLRWRTAFTRTHLLQPLCASDCNVIDVRTVVRVRTENKASRHSADEKRRSFESRCPGASRLTAAYRKATQAQSNILSRLFSRVSHPSEVI